MGRADGAAHQASVKPLRTSINVSTDEAHRSATPPHSLRTLHIAQHALGHARCPDAHHPFAHCV